jgi:hypothetical protein
MVLGADAVGEGLPRATHSQKMHIHATCVAHLCIVCVSSPSDIKLELLFLGIIRAQTLYLSTRPTRHHTHIQQNLVI